MRLKLQNRNATNQDATHWWIPILSKASEKKFDMNQNVDQNFTRPRQFIHHRAMKVYMTD
jgi:hypothetical protein